MGGSFARMCMDCPMPSDTTLAAIAIGNLIGVALVLLICNWLGVK